MPFVRARVNTSAVVSKIRSSAAGTASSGNAAVFVMTGRHPARARDEVGHPQDARSASTVSTDGSASWLFAAPQTTRPGSSAPIRR
jgi:hypothetical protein